MELVLPMYNVYPYISLKNVGKSMHYTWQNMVNHKLPRKSVRMKSKIQFLFSHDSFRYSCYSFTLLFMK